MRKTIVAILLVSVLGVIPLSAKEHGFGIGVIAGEPTGITAKTYLSGNDAVDIAASWSFVREAIYLHADYIRHFPGVIDRDFDDFILYAGIGGLIELGNENAFGARMPVGINYFFPELPIELFLEIGPAFLLLPETRFELTGGIGARFYL